MFGSTFCYDVRTTWPGGRIGESQGQALNLILGIGSSRVVVIVYLRFQRFLSVIFSFCKLTSVLRSGERDLYLRKILQWPVHVLLLHLSGGDDEDS